MAGEGPLHAMKDRCPVNPASLMRQARKSAVLSEDEVAPMAMAPRHRRASAPATCAEPLPEGQGGAGLSSGFRGKTFKTVGKAAVRTFPSAMSLKISDLPQGWKVVEAQAEDLATGWVAIEPRGYVLSKDLAPASPLRMESSRPDAVADAVPRLDSAADAVPRLTPRTARRSAPEAPTRLASVAEEVAAGPRSARGQKPRSTRNSVGDAGTAARNATRAGGDGAVWLPPGARSSCQSPRTGCVSPQKSRAGMSPQRSRAGVSPQRFRSAQDQPPASGGLRASRSLLTLRRGGLEAMEVLHQMKEEHVHLRESNVDLREKELEKRRALEELDRRREAMAEEVRQLQRSKELHEQQEEKMKEKLVRCRDVVAKAVGSIDELYTQQDISVRTSIGMMSSQGSVDGDSCRSGANGDAHIELHDAKVRAKEAGEEVCELLTAWSEDADQENTEASTIVAKKMVEEAFLSERAPLRTCNAGF